MKRALGSLVALALSFAAFAPSRADQPPMPGQPAPDFTLPVIANGSGQIALSSFKGHGVYLNFFASWCDPCKEEAPWLSKIARVYAKRNVVVVGIDELDQTQPALAFVKKYRLQYGILSDTDGRVGATYGVNALPLHIFIAPSGKIKAAQIGPMTEREIKTEMDLIAAKP
ncbi:MAG TPA: TlpA disulfide reductase family protein [Candidatus Tumulicola sp.]|nr:TlpA disulfide reductase family protein [Candidatus Tumulicola sp.]